MKEELIRYLSEEGFSMRKSVAIWFDREAFFMPEWLNGHKSMKQRVLFQDREDHNWVKIEVQFIGNQEYDVMFEGCVYTFDQFKLVYETMLKLNEK